MNAAPPPVFPAPRPRNFRDHFGLVLRGAAMGAADVVPGVSGGTIAMISGIYEELVDSIRAIGPEALRCLMREGFRAFWATINGSFLLALVTGIALSLFSLARFIRHGLETQPILVWAFFFGLVAASALFVGRRIRRWSPGKIAALVLGAGLSYVLTIVAPVAPNTAPWFVFLSGAIAICAMILPGISGSFILVLLGMYPYVLTAVSDLRLTVLVIFAAGAGSGLLAFSRLLSWLLHRYHDLTIAALVGVMLGSLSKVWPWKQVVAWHLDRHGHTVPAVEVNLWPWRYPELPAAELVGHTQDPQWLWALVLALGGFAIIALFERLSRPADSGEEPRA